MPLPDVPNCYSVTMNVADDTGIQSHSRFHVRRADSNATEISQGIADAADPNMIYVASVATVVVSFEVKELVADGTEFTRTPTSPIDGHSGSGNVPAVAAVISLQTGLSGRSNRGRIFVGPVGEEAMENVRLEDSFEGALATGWDNFVDGLQSLAEPIELVIISYYSGVSAGGVPIPRAVPVVNPVTNLVLHTVLGTQRRRQSKLRFS